MVHTSSLKIFFKDHIPFNYHLGGNLLKFIVNSALHSSGTHVARHPLLFFLDYMHVSLHFEQCVLLPLAKETSGQSAHRVCL